MVRAEDAPRAFPNTRAALLLFVLFVFFVVIFLCQPGLAVGGGKA
jgi:hypothetical protein